MVTKHVIVERESSGRNTYNEDDDGAVLISIERADERPVMVDHSERVR